MIDPLVLWAMTAKFDPDDSDAKFMLSLAFPLAYIIVMASLLAVGFIIFGIILWMAL